MTTPVFRVIAKPSPFLDERTCFELPVGMTLWDVAERSPIDPHIWPTSAMALNSQVIPFDAWGNLKPGCGAIVTFHGIPGSTSGPMGQSGIIGKDTLRLVTSLLSVGIGVAAPELLGLSGMAATALRIGVSALGLVTSNMLIAPPAMGDEARDVSLTGAKNRLRPNEPVPMIFGRMRIFPPLGGVPITHYAGEDQYLSLLFVVGLGPLRISSARIGASPLSLADIQSGVDTRSTRFKDIRWDYTAGTRTDWAMVGQGGAPRHYAMDVWDDPYPTQATLSCVVDDADEPLLPGPLSDSDTADHWQVGVETGTNLPLYADNVLSMFTQIDTCKLQVLLAFPQGLGRQNGSDISPWRVDVVVRVRERNSTGQWEYLKPDTEAPAENDTAAVTREWIYDWLDQFKDKMAEFLHDLEFAFAGQDLPVNLTALRTRLLSTMNRILAFLEDDEGDTAGAETTRTELISIITDIAANIQSRASGAGDALFEAFFGQLTTGIDFVTDLMAINRYLQNLGPDETLDPNLVMTPFARWLIAANWNIDYLFAPRAAEAAVITRAKNEPLYVTFTYEAPAGVATQYEVQVGRVSKETDDSGFLEDVQWVSLRSIKADLSDPAKRPAEAFNAIELPPLAMASMWIKASNQLSGSLDEFNVIAEACLRAYVDGEWTEPSVEYGRNPAWCYCHVLLDAMCWDELGKSHMALPVASLAPFTANIDVDSFVEWAAYCEANGLTCDAIVDTDITIFELLKKIAACGFASYAEFDGKQSIVIDNVRTAPTQLFTPRNSRNFTASRAYVDHPHGMKVRYVDPDENWGEQETVIYSDGYSQEGTGGTKVATVFEELRLWGVSDSTKKNSQFYTGLARKHARRTMAQALLRPESFELEVDVEHLVCRRGDMVLVQNDVILVGHGAARITEVVLGTGPNAGKITLLRIDNDATMVGGKTYRARVRRSDGVIVSVPLATVIGTNASLSPASFAQTSPAIAVGDLIEWGEAGSEVIECIVKEVRRQDDLGAVLSLQQYSPEVFDVTDAPIPEWNPYISVPPPAFVSVPPRPMIKSVKSDESVLVRNANGSLEPRIVVTFVPEWIGKAKLAGVELQTRISGTAWGGTERYPGQMNAVSISGYKERQVVDLRLRYVNEEGMAGNWSVYLGHEVVGKTSPPPDVQDVSESQDASGAHVIRWSYPNPPFDFAGFQVRWMPNAASSSWRQARPAHQGLLSVNEFRIPSGTYGATQWWVLAVDSGGNYSRYPEHLYIDLDEPGMDALVSSSSHYADGWTGSARNASVVSGYLRGDSVADGDIGKMQFWRRGGESMWGDLINNREFWPYRVSPFFYYFEYTAPRDGLLKIDVTTDGTYGSPRYGIYVLDDSVWSERFWPSTMGETLWPSDMKRDLWPVRFSWMPSTGVMTVKSGVTYSFRVEVSREGYPLTAGVVELRDVTLRLYAQKKVAIINNAFILPIGTRLTLPYAFESIEVVFLTLQQSPGGEAVAAVVGDKNAALGPTVYVLDNYNNSIGGTVDARIEGY